MQLLCANRTHALQRGWRNWFVPKGHKNVGWEQCRLVCAKEKQECGMGQGRHDVLAIAGLQEVQQLQEEWCKEDMTCVLRWGRHV